MFTSIIKELLGTKIAEYNEILPHYRFKNIILLILNRKAAIAIASQEELRSISGNINLNHTMQVCPFISY